MTASKKAQSATVATAPSPVTLYRLYEVAHEVDGANYADLQQWEKDDQIDTPAAAFDVNGTLHWTADSFPAWKELVDRELQRVAEVGYTLESMVDKLGVMAQRVDDLATYARSRARGGYSKTAVAESITGVEAVLRFLSGLSETGRIEPKEKRVAINQHISSAKDKLDRK